MSYQPQFSRHVSNPAKGPLLPRQEDSARDARATIARQRKKQMHYACVAKPSDRRAGAKAGAKEPPPQLSEWIDAPSPSRSKGRFHCTRRQSSCLWRTHRAAKAAAISAGMFSRQDDENDHAGSPNKPADPCKPSSLWRVPMPLEIGP